MGAGTVRVGAGVQVGAEKLPCTLPWLRSVIATIALVKKGYHR